MKTVVKESMDDLEHKLTRLNGAAELVLLLHPDNKEAVALAKMILNQNPSGAEYPFADNPILAQYSKEDFEKVSFSGGKIDQIKSFRAVIGVGLKDAKDAVEELERLGHITFT